MTKKDQSFGNPEWYCEEILRRENALQGKFGVKVADPGPPKKLQNCSA
jgi:hypothetical protein